MKEYLTISQRESIQDTDVAKILDYVERHDSKFRPFLNKASMEYGTYDFFLGNKFCIVKSEKNWGCSFIDSGRIIIPTKVLADNIVGIYGSLRDYYLK